MEIQPELWRSLTTLLLDYPENNMYHLIFYRIFVDVLHSQHAPLHKVVITNHVHTCDSRLYRRFFPKPSSFRK